MDDNTLDASIFELANNFAVIQDVDTLLKQITSAVEKLTSSEAASILLLDETKRQLVFRVATGEKGSMVKKFFVPVGKGIAGWVAEHGEAVLINDVQSDTRFTGQIDKSSGFKTKSILAVPMKMNEELIGVCEALNKEGEGYTEDDKRLLFQLATLAATTISNARLAENHRNFFTHMIDLLTIAIEGVDTKLSGHSYRVAELSCRIGLAMGLKGEAYRNLYYAAILHDLGRIAIHDLRYLPKVINKTMERTPEKLHPLVGAELVKNIHLLSPTAPLILHHHEYVDGSGHPDGLVGSDIPLGARILCLAEHIDALHMKGLAGDEYHAQAALLAREGSGTKFDPDVVNAYLSLNP